MNKMIANILDNNCMHSFGKQKELFIGLELPAKNSKKKHTGQKKKRNQFFLHFLKQLEMSAEPRRSTRERREPERLVEEEVPEPVKKTVRRRAAPKKGGKRAPAKGKGKKKDPNAPKRPLTSFMYFSQDQRAAVKKANPDASFGELGRLLGAKWRKTTAAQKKKYEAQAAKDKVRYTKAMAAYEKKGKK
jgi:HMG (high mobility group) box